MPNDHSAGPAKLIPKSLLGTSVWWRFCWPSISTISPRNGCCSVETPGTGFGGEHLNADWSVATVVPADLPGVARAQRLSAYQQADETRWLVFVEKDGKQGHRWWLWVFNGEDTVVYVLDPARSHDVPEGHFTAGISIVLMVIGSHRTRRWRLSRQA